MFWNCGGLKTSFENRCTETHYSATTYLVIVSVVFSIIVIVVIIIIFVIISVTDSNINHVQSALVYWRLTLIKDLNDSEMKLILNDIRIKTNLGCATFHRKGNCETSTSCFGIESWRIYENVHSLLFDEIFGKIWFGGIFGKILGIHELSSRANVKHFHKLTVDCFERSWREDENCKTRSTQTHGSFKDQARSQTVDTDLTLNSILDWVGRLDKYEAEILVELVLAFPFFPPEPNMLKTSSYFAPLIAA